jgi:para-aminobenzoate synthetase component 1
VIIPVTDPELFKLKALRWASSFDVFCYMDSNNFSDQYSKFDILLAVGIKDELLTIPGSSFEALENFRSKNPGWIMGFLTYDLKNEIEKLESCNSDYLKFPELYFFAPHHLLVMKDGQVEIISDDPDGALNEIDIQSVPDGKIIHQTVLNSRFNEQEYIDTVVKIKEHISRGDIYVTNFCQEFFSENTVIDPLQVFIKLNQISPNPFAVFFKLRDRYILSASPERFLAKRGSKLVSQPIKGTSKRYDDPKSDNISKENLKGHPKELQENVMIVDLVRNDLTKSAKPGTVATEELFGIYSFRHVHQMISTVVCELSDDISVIEAIKNTFPMGSMTGAPKINAMQLMEEYERGKRGVYSGAVGYFSPDGDFDFNVVIRTLLYNDTDQYLSFQVGSAITYHAEPEKEYEECLLKAQAILEVLGQSGFSFRP